MAGLMKIETEWRPALAARLASAAHPSGGWSYRCGKSVDAEPTALAALALTAIAEERTLVDAGLDRLAGLQLPSGAVPISSSVSSPHWPTALALIAMLRCAKPTDTNHGAAALKAVNWLLESRGKSLPVNRRVRDHDSTLIGWSWVAGTHSWVEPTCYAILALQAAGKADHPRVREGVRLLLDRALSDGGWNYGNRRVFDNTLRAFPSTSGLALAAVAGEARSAPIDAALEYLRGKLASIRAPLSLAWALIGLRAWDAWPDRGEARLAECADRLAHRPANPHYEALLLLAAAPACPFTGTGWEDRGA